MEAGQGRHLVGHPFSYSRAIGGGRGLALYGGWGRWAWADGGELWPVNTPEDTPAPLMLDVLWHNPGGIEPQSRPVNRRPSGARSAACGPISSAQWPAAAAVFQPVGAGHPWSVISLGWLSIAGVDPAFVDDRLISSGYFGVLHVARDRSRLPIVDALDCTDPDWVRRVWRSSEAGIEVLDVPEALHPRDPSPNSELDDGAWRWSIGPKERHNTPTGPVLGLGYTRTRHTPPCEAGETCTESGLLMYGVGPVPDFGTRWTLEHFHLGPERETGTP